MAVLNQDNNIKLQALTDSETDAITGGLIPCETADGSFALIAHLTKYPTLKDAQTALDALKNTASYYNDTSESLTPIALKDGNYALMSKDIGLFDTLDGANSACQALKEMNGVY